MNRKTAYFSLRFAQVRSHSAWFRVLSMMLFACGYLLAVSCNDSRDSAIQTKDGEKASPINDSAKKSSRSDIDSAIEKFEPLAQEALDATGVPGMAIAIVFDDALIYAKGFGVKKLGNTDPVDADTVFQIASLSKPLASTVVAGLVGQGVIAWEEPIIKYDPGFLLSDPLVTEQVSFADLFAHRSGLPDHAGDLLEDLGFDREEIIARLQYLPLKPIRTSYAYTNFGLTEAAIVAAKVAGLDWNKASSKIVYDPLGMDSSSSSFDDYLKRNNRATAHMLANGKYTSTSHQRQPDAQSPAGGASASVNDLARWMRLTINGGSIEEKKIINADALAETKIPHAVSRPPSKPGTPTSFYGLGWGVSQNSRGQVVWSHSGAFLLGAATNVTILPSEGLGIVILTNGTPVGLPESLARTFTDLVFEGEPMRNWLALYRPAFEEMSANLSKTDWNSSPSPPLEAVAPSFYVGAYENPYFGELNVIEIKGDLVMSLGPKPIKFPLTHYNGNVFYYEPVGENAVGPSGVTFTIRDKLVTSIIVENLDEFGLGTFTRQ